MKELVFVAFVSILVLISFWNMEDITYPRVVMTLVGVQLIAIIFYYILERTL